MVQFLKRQWFLGAIIAISFCSYLFPSVFLPLAYQSTFFIAVVMFLTGLQEDWKSIFHASKNSKALLFSSFYSFILLPVLGMLIGKIFLTHEPDMYAGLLCMLSVGTTLGSSVIWTKMAKGNFSLSLILSIVSTLLSVFLTPTIIFISLGKSIALSPLSMIISIVQSIVIPILIAQLIRFYLPQITKKIEPIPTLSIQIIILTLIAIAIAKAAPILSFSMLYKTLPSIIFLYCFMIIFTSVSSKKFGFKTKDGIALAFSSSQKTLTTSLLIVTNYFNAAAIIPCLLYHLSQQFLSVFFVEFFRQK